ncbi:MAG: ATP phosphoribosyltransferase regulatory subunit [Spirochaetaceae bacterium]|jgi:ATP phosphoribosyltransferase regulatory subunit|nr:ATP phosphoribosyltransferase regulatory subunit [Spirochaetaceae bacterium]
MTEKKNGLLQIPQGVEGLYLEEAFRHRKITKHIENVFTLWGYLPVETPVFDFFDTYSHLLDKNRAEQTYRLIDREGELLMLRSDITLFLAKQMSLALDEKDLPVRVFYADTILRYESHEDISSNEFFQSGCELIGKPGKDGDLEIILLLFNIFREINLKSVKIHIGSRSLLNSLCTNFNDREMQKLNVLIDTRSRDKIKKIFAEKGHSEEQCRIIVSLLMFIGTSAQFETFINENRTHFNIEALKEIKYLLGIADTIKKLEGFENFRIDISEIGGQDYYTGIVFSAYLEGLSTAAASGGRYDSLFDKFGYSASSVGFSMMQRKIEPLLSESERYAPPEAWIRKEKEDFNSAYERASRLKKEGKTFVL